MSDQPAARGVSRPARVVVVGGGFSGTMTAVNLARLADDPLEITIVNERTPPGRGVAYRRRRPEYLLNVATRNMSAFPDNSDHFLRWVSTRPGTKQCRRSTFVNGSFPDRPTATT